MELKKSKVFTKKLIALFLAALMVISTFTGVMTVFAKSTEDYHDNNLAANFLAWAETTDNQTAEALLDYADLYLPQIMEGLDLGDIKPRGSTRINFSYDVPVIGTIKLQGYVDSIDGVLELVKYIQENILNGKFMGRSYKNWIGGDVDNIDFSAIYDLNTSTTEGVVSKCGVAYRSQNDAKDVIICVAKLIYNLSNDWSGSNIVNNFIKGELDLGLVGNFLNLWDTLKSPLNMWDGYQTNLVYNIAANLIFENTDWYTQSEIEVFKQDFVNNGKNQTKWNFDDQLFGMLTSKLVQQINIQVTYSNKVQSIELDPNNEKYGQYLVDDNGEPVYVKDSSKRRWFLIYKYMKQGQTYAQAVASVNKNEGAAEGFYCDPNLRYSMNPDGTSDGNILLFTYGDNVLTVEKTDTITDIAFNAAEIAWSTVLEPTISLLEVDYDRKVESSVFEGQVSNFDRAFYAWKSANGGWTKSDSDENAWKANYTAANVQAWAEDVYADYNYLPGVTPSAEAFLEGVAETYDFDRTRIEDPQNNWRDVDATKLFVELRYSPLADIYFNKQTGPINLYFAETGAANLKTFFSTAFDEYDSLIGGLNDALVAAVKDFFPDSNNIGMSLDGNFVNLNRPDMALTSSTDSQEIATTLVSNAAKMFEYAANSADENILGAFYAADSSRDPFSLNSISEANIEEAALPMLIAILNQWNMTDVIHDDEWDTCVDAEGVAVTALAEYLSYVLPDKDYSDLYGVVDGKLVPTYDVDGKNGITWLEDVIMPMARDAVGYLLQSVVPCRKTDKTEWSVYTSDPKTDQTTIFDLLNSVLCYYGSTDTFPNDHGAGASTVQGKGVAALLGCVDSNGKCTISFDKTIWQNIDTMVNTLLPVVGSLQNGTFGGADSYDLIYTKMIKGVLNISDNGGAITNIIKQLCDIVKSAPLNTGADVALYDYIVAPTVNGIFGGKYSGQSFSTVIPATASYYDSDSSSNTSGSSPFNALVHIDTLGGYGNGTGVLCVLICNLIEAFGVNDYKSKSGDRWQGAMFAVKAVNNFIPSFVPQLSEMQFGPVTAKMDVSTYSGMNGNQSLTTTSNYLTITNTAIGLNRFYRESATGDVQREPRYFAEIKNVELVNDDGVVGPTLQSTSYGVLSPGESLKIPINGAAPRRDGTYIYKAQVTYNMFEAELNDGQKPTANGNYMFSADITTTAYLTITVGGAWQSIIYPDNRADKDGDTVTKYKYATTFVNNTAGTVKGSGDNQVKYSAAGGESNNLIAGVPTNMVIPSEDPSIANKFSIRVRNNGSATRSYSGIVAFAADGTEYYPVNGTTVSDSLATVSGNTSTNLAYALIDEDGNLLNNEMYDYRIKNTDGTYGEWQRGYSRTTLDNMEKEGGSLYTAFSEHRVEERTSIAYTFAEACAAGIVKGVQMNDNGTYKNVFVAPSAALVASESASAITWAAPFDGYYFINHGASIGSSSDTFDLFLEYDGNGVTPSKEATVMNLCFVTPSGNYMTTSTNVYVADQSDLYSLSTAINEEVTKMASYRPADFLDFDEATGTSENYNAIIESMTSALDLAATPLSVANAAKVSSTKIGRAETSQTVSATGDKAYRPATAAEIPAEVLKYAYKSGDIYYINKECTEPIYSNVALTDADVTNGKDAAGQAVTKVGGVYYLANDAAYDSEWDTETYWLPNPDDENAPKIGAPYWGVVEDEEHRTKWGEELVYNQIQFVYRDANGNKVNSNDKFDDGTLKWVVKFASTETVIKPNDGTDYRGAYQQGIDTMNYWNSTFSKILKTVGAQSVAEEVTAVRSVDSNSVNYDVAIYEKMVMVAREAEKLIWYEDATDAEGNYIYNEDGSRKQVPVTDKSSMEIEIAVNRFKAYYARAQANSRGYIGGRLEKEISDHHAIGGTYANFTATKTGEQVRFAYSTKDWNEEDNVDVYTIKVAAGTNIGFGTRDSEGNLVNADADGNKIYTDESWDAYVNALGAAVETATEQTAKVSEVYTAKSHLVMAENNLQEYKEDEGGDTNKFTVTGKITIAEDSEGTSGIYGVGGIEIKMGNEVVGVSAEDGSFEIKLPKGEPVGLTITGDTTVDRNITINGDANVENINIPVVVCDYLKDGSITYKDVAVFVDIVDSPEDYTVYADLLKDGAVTYKDVALFVDFVDVPVVYEQWSQATYVFE